MIIKEIQTTLDFAKQIYPLRTILRYPNYFRVNQESVAEHSFFVAVLVRNLAKRYKFNKEKAIEMALIHDFSEVSCTDIPHVTKVNYPRLAKVIKDVEIEIISREFSDEEVVLLAELERGETIEAKMVLLADVISCVQYSETEISLGNTGIMTKVLYESYGRIKDLLEELEVFRR